MNTISAGAVLACYQEVTGRRLSPAEIPALLSYTGMARGRVLAGGHHCYRTRRIRGKEGGVERARVVI